MRLLVWMLLLLLTPTMALAQDGAGAETETDSEADSETETGAGTGTDADMYVESSTRPIREPSMGDVFLPISSERLRYWQRGEPRWFVGGIVDFGYLYLRPSFQVGYGRPHWSWVGLELEPLISTSYIGGYLGLHAALPFIELRVGGRYVFTFSQSYLAPRQSYAPLDLESSAGPPSRSLALQAQLVLKIPLGPGDFRSVITGTYLALVDDGFYVYDNILRLVAAPPWNWGATAGYRISFGPNASMYVQPMAELVHLVERQAFIVRAGAAVGAQLWPDLELRLRVLPQVYGPDPLGGKGGYTIQFGIRYRFATDAPNFED